MTLPRCVNLLHLKCSLTIVSCFSSVYYTSDSDHQKLLSDVRDVFKWMELNQLKVAVEKCAVLHLGAMNPCRDYATDDNNVIPPVNSIRDIGILMSDDLKF